MWKDLGFSDNDTSKVIGTISWRNFQVIFTIMIRLKCIINMTCVFRLFKELTFLTEIKQQKKVT